VPRGRQAAARPARSRPGCQRRGFPQGRQRGGAPRAGQAAALHEQGLECQAAVAREEAGGAVPHAEPAAAAAPQQGALEGLAERLLLSYNPQARARRAAARARPPVLTKAKICDVET
jgi:hypothetical protein